MFMYAKKGWGVFWWVVVEENLVFISFMHNAFHVVKWRGLSPRKFTPLSLNMPPVAWEERRRLTQTQEQTGRWQMMKYSRAFSLEGKSLLGGNGAWVMSSLARNAVKKCHPDQIPSGQIWFNEVLFTCSHFTHYSLELCQLLLKWMKTGLYKVKICQ